MDSRRKPVRPPWEFLWDWQKPGWRRFLWRNKVSIVFGTIGSVWWLSRKAQTEFYGKRREVIRCEAALKRRFGPTYDYRFPNGTASYPNGWSDLEKMGYSRPHRD